MANYLKQRFLGQTGGRGDDAAPVVRGDDPDVHVGFLLNSDQDVALPLGNTSNGPADQSAKSPSLEVVVVDGDNPADQTTNGDVVGQAPDRRRQVSGGAAALRAQERNIFCQMDVLYHFEDGDMEWREAARYVSI
jgi:hypothetical protein